MKQSAVIYANQYGYFDMENTLNEIEAAYHSPECDRQALLSTYRRAKRQLTKCRYPATKQLLESLKPRVENDTPFCDAPTDKNSHESLSVG